MAALIDWRNMCIWRQNITEISVKTKTSISVRSYTYLQVIARFNFLLVSICFLFYVVILTGRRQFSPDTVICATIS